MDDIQADLPPRTFLQTLRLCAEILGVVTSIVQAGLWLTGHTNIVAEIVVLTGFCITLVCGCGALGVFADLNDLTYTHLPLIGRVGSLVTVAVVLWLLATLVEKTFDRSRAHRVESDSLLILCVCLTPIGLVRGLWCYCGARYFGSGSYDDTFYSLGWKDDGPLICGLIGCLAWAAMLGSAWLHLRSHGRNRNQHQTSEEHG